MDNIGQARTVKIGPVTYEIKVVRGLMDDAKNTKLWGQISYENCIIELEEDQNSSANRVILWHEIVHGLLQGSGHSKLDDKEDLVTALAYGIVGVLKDNPWLAEKA